MFVSSVNVYTFMDKSVYLFFVTGEELSKKQAAQEAQIRKLRAQVLL